MVKKVEVMETLGLEEPSLNTFQPCPISQSHFY